MIRKISFVKISCKPTRIQNIIFRVLSSNKNENNLVKKTDENEKKKLTDDNDNKKSFLMGYIQKIKRNKDDKQEERKGPFKNYYSDEERDKNKIMRYEEFIDRNTKKKDKENFINAIEIYKLSSSTKNLYIDFIYGALLKMKEYNAHNSLEAYRKLMELFPIGPLVCRTKWQVDNMHYPRHQNCAIQILEQMERNGVILDEDMVRLAIKIFGDWTHVVRKAKRQLYWLPKFKNANPYPLPSKETFEDMLDIDLAIFALDRMCKPADLETKITVHYSDDLKEKESENEKTWIVSAQSSAQKELLQKHNTAIPIFVDGPIICWVRSKMVEYYIMKTDTLDETKEKFKKIKEFDDYDFTNAYTVFEDPFNTKAVANKKPEMSVHELLDGNIYAICCTGTKSKTSLYNWMKILELENESLRNKLVVFRIKEKSSFLIKPENDTEEKKATH